MIPAAPRAGASRPISASEADRQSTAPLSTTRWNLVVSRRTDETLREVLATSGRTHPDDLSRFVGEAVIRRIVAVEAEAARRENMNRTEAEIVEAVEEAPEWARRR